MRNLFYHAPLVLLLVFFSLHGSGQADTTKKKSDSPLLDKYYTRPKEDTVAAKPVKKSTGVQQQTVKTPAPVKQVTIEEKRLNFPTPIRPVIAITPPLPDSILTVVAEAPVNPVPVEEPPISTSLSTSTIVADTRIAMPIKDNSKITSPVITTAKVVPSKKPVSKPEGSLLRTRLGSSSPLYNTYEKNKNGAGSVTTLPKG